MGNNVATSTAWQAKTSGIRLPVPLHYSPNGETYRQEVIFVIAKRDYSAQGVREIDLEKNNRYLLLDDTKYWWNVVNDRGCSGYVPSNYVKREKPSLFDSIKKKVRVCSGSKTLRRGNSRSLRLLESAAASRGLPVDRPEPIGTAVVKYNCPAVQEGELPLTKGSRILLLEKDSGWFKGDSGCATGWFPCCYVQVEADVDETLRTYAVAGNFNDIFVALESFTSFNDSFALSFKAGERLEILEKATDMPGWYLARNLQDRIGLIPTAFVQELSEYLIPVAENGSECGDNNDSRLVGDFLVRKSQKNSGYYSVTLKTPCRNWQFRMLAEANIYRIGLREFHDLDHLVDPYQKEPIYTNVHGERLYLVRPLPRCAAPPPNET